MKQVEGNVSDPIKYINIRVFLTVCLQLSFTRDLKHSMFIWVNYLLPYFGLILVWKKYTK